MKEMPGIISRMPPLPVSVNNDLANRLMTSTLQVSNLAFTLHMFWMRPLNSLVYSTFDVKIDFFLFKICFSAETVYHSFEHPSEARAKKLMEEGTL